MTDVNNEETQIAPPLSIGERLRLAREAKNITIPEVSAQLRLVRDNIYSLETGQWSDLHGRAYARGYLISYVKFLGLSVPDFLTAFNREFETSASETPLSNNVARLIEEKGFPWFKVLVVIILAMITWFSYQQWLQYKSELAVTQTSAVASDELLAETNLFSKSVVEPIISSSKFGDQESNNTNMKLSIGEPSIAVSPDTISPVIEMVEQTIMQQQDIDTAVDSIVDQQAIASAEPATVAEVNPSIDKLTQAKIELIFTEDCWVNITDAKGQVLLNRVMYANSNIELMGQMPLRFTMGRASAVIMKVDGEDFDLTAHTGVNVAKFILGAES